ncbi:MAG TPA: hypothetical protein VK211_23430 [Kamptonema sp.]|nr:hypothetical protein [Kamptonema sp.]
MQATITGIQTGSNTETSKLLTKILNTFYTSGIDRIKTYGKTPSGNIVGEFIADGTSFQYILNMKTNTVFYEPVGSKAANKADSLLAESENADRFKMIYSVREAFEISDASAIEQKLDSWFFRADAPAKAKVGVKAKANKSGKTLTCTPGKTFPCGAVCRAVGKPCKQPMSPEVQGMAKQVAAKIKTPTAAMTLPTQPATATELPTSKASGKITAQKLAEQIAATKTPESDLGKKGENRLMPIFVNSKRVNGLTQEFDEKDLREAAEVFIKLGGFTEPPVLKRKGEGADISYDLVSGEFQVATAIVAKAMQPKVWDTFPATVIEEGNEELIQKQMKAQKKANAAQNTGTTTKKQGKAQSIESYDDFKKTANNTYENLNKSYNYGGLVPIWHLRKEIGEQVKREEFNDWIMKMQTDRSFYLQSGEARGATKEQKENSITDDIRGLLFFASRPSS